MFQITDRYEYDKLAAAAPEQIAATIARFCCVKRGYLKKGEQYFSLANGEIETVQQYATGRADNLRLLAEFLQGACVPVLRGPSCTVWVKDNTEWVVQFWELLDSLQHESGWKLTNDSLLVVSLSDDEVYTNADEGTLSGVELLSCLYASRQSKEQIVRDPIENTPSVVGGGLEMAVKEWARFFSDSPEFQAAIKIAETGPDAMWHKRLHPLV